MHTFTLSSRERYAKTHSVTVGVIHSNRKLCQSQTGLISQTCWKSTISRELTRLFFGQDPISTVVTLVTVTAGLLLVPNSFSVDIWSQTWKVSNNRKKIGTTIFGNDQYVFLWSSVILAGKVSEGSKWDHNGWLCQKQRYLAVLRCQHCVGW